jgi:phenylalanyl-tRNA synthetase beta chain
MKVPLSWLREYVAVEMSVAELARRLTLAGLEVSGARAFGLPIPAGLKADEPGPTWAKDKVVTAQVLKVEKHPNADKLKLVHANYGAGEPKVVVTGAPNLSVGDSGQKVVIGLSGTEYWDGHATPKKLSTLKPTQLRGVPSDAMVMSEFELGLSDEHEGIIILPQDTAVGVPLGDLWGDYVLDLDILPNMARCLSLLGISREVAAITGGTVKLPPTDYPAKGEPITGKVTVAIADPKLSARYAASLIHNVKIGPSPAWMQRRLAAAGMRPISNVVDITNYVMLEWGQPLHAFDYDLLVKRAGGKPPGITVRPAKAGEILVTLDGVERKLTPETLVIADTAGPVALAGVMGGRDTEVSDRSTNILLESANFDLVSIRRTMRALDLPSEASVRFSKGIHPELVPHAAGRAARLFAEHAGGAVAAGIADTYPGKPTPQVVELRLSEVKRILGVDVPPLEVTRILTALEFKVEPAGADLLRITTPPNRLDIQAGAADLIEEIARIHGYDRIPATLLADPLPPQTGNADLEREERVRDRLVDLGCQEVITYSLTTPEREAPLNPPPAGYVTIVNPISTERSAMRHTLLAGVLEVVAFNLKHGDTVKVFEVGGVYLQRDGQKLPDEPRRLAIALTGKRTPPAWQEGTTPPGEMDFFDLKGVVEALVGDLHLPNVTYQRASASHLHPGRSADLLIAGKPVGSFGELHPKVAKLFDVAGRPVLVAEFDLEAILSAIPGRFAYSPVPRFPAALRDVAVVLPEDVTAERVLAEIRTAGGDLLRDVRLFDVYRGPSIPTGTKSLAFALTYQADDRTLTDKEVDKAHQKIESRLGHVLKGTIRGKE